ncbi:unnamed protein product [Albugo candida]|uniref:Uncharacterized protein n=1 Tax=Albugo candida TaxID=65357 RepID=A0A024FUM2_9STRA|nr:unnamed protein product [Albugo candida]|eukprot:CCI10825.1 unnamed protein product [Albugo candida]
MSLKSDFKPREADIFQAYCFGGPKPLPTLPGIELTTSGRGLAVNTHVFRPCVPRFESRRWQKGCDGAPRRRQ